MWVVQGLSQLVSLRLTHVRFDFFLAFSELEELAQFE